MSDCQVVSVRNLNATVRQDANSSPHLSDRRILNSDEVLKEA